MPRYLIVPAILMSLALVSYTFGVWAERLERYLRAWHLAAFWLGLVLDAAGTEMMLRLLREGMGGGLHTFFGATAFLLMLGHALWASWVVARGSAEARARFHTYSLAVWVVWLVPYLGGMIAGIAKGAAG